MRRYQCLANKSLPNVLKKFGQSGNGKLSIGSIFIKSSLADSKCVVCGSLDMRDTEMSLDYLFPFSLFYTYSHFSLLFLSDTYW